MNAAAREINESNLFTGQIRAMRISSSLLIHMVLLFAVLFSALAVVYVTNLHRLALSQLQMEEQQTNQLELQWGQLLLEQASLATPSRVQELAEEKLHMVLPAAKQTFILRSR